MSVRVPVRAVAAIVLLLASTATVVPLAGADVEGGLTADIEDTGGSTAHADSQTNETVTDTETIDKTFRVALTPDQPGVVRVTLTVSIPDGVGSLSTYLPAKAEVVDTDGFERRSDTRYEWTGEDRTPTVRYRLPVNRTVRRDVEGVGGGGHLFVDAGKWALIAQPRAGITYRGRGDEPAFTATVIPVDEGAVGGSTMFLGEHTELTGTGADQRFQLIVPEAATMSSDPDRVLASLTTAARELDVGSRDDTVFVVAAPRDPVDWGSTGLQFGDSDFWVLDDRRLDGPSNTWIHEYVHTRQTFRPTPETRWLVEGMADYYAAQFAYRHGGRDYDRFRAHLARGTRNAYADAVLSDPSTWDDPLVPYDKGALVFGAIDRRIRLAGDRSIDAAVRRFDDGRLDQAAFLDAIEAVSNNTVRRFTWQHTEMSDSPDTWSLEAYQAAFGEDRPSFAYEFDPPYTRAGPYRNDTTWHARAVIGERLTFPVRVENVGTATGEFTARLRLHGHTMSVRSGTLAPGESMVISLPARFTNTGTHRVAVAGASERVRIRNPGEVRITALSVAGSSTQVRVPAGSPVRVSAVATSAANRPASGQVTVTVNGERVATRIVRVAAGETAVVDADIEFETGDRTVRVGNRTVRVKGVTPTASADHRSVGSGPPHHNAGERSWTQGFGPGFSGLAAVVALLSAALVQRAARR